MVPANQPLGSEDDDNVPLDIYLKIMTFVCFPSEVRVFVVSAEGKQLANSSVCNWCNRRSGIFDVVCAWYFCAVGCDYARH